MAAVDSNEALLSTGPGAVAGVDSEATAMGDLTEAMATGTASVEAEVAAAVEAAEARAPGVAAI